MMARLSALLLVLLASESCLSSPSSSSVVEVVLPEDEGNGDLEDNFIPGDYLFSYDDDMDIFTTGTGGLASPPSGDEEETGLTASCPCKQLLVSSLGEAQHLQAGAMGVYKLYSTYNGRPSYHGPHSNRLYFLNTGWIVGATIGAPVGFVHNGSQYACPYLIPGGWMYVNNGYWYKDDTLVVRCIA